MNVLLKIIPWGLAVIFLALWILERLGQNLDYYYDEQGYTQMSMKQKALEGKIQALENYIMANRDYQTDLEAFEMLELINVDQNDRKYEPWKNTKLGLVRFNESGFISNICATAAQPWDTNCHPK